jgi:DNA-binding IclR family transcriptional regulator
MQISTNSEDAVQHRESGRSIRRFVELLELFDQRRRALTSAQIAEALQSPRSSTAALLRGLVDLGVLIMDRRSATFLPSTHLSDLTGWVVQAWLPEQRFLDRLESLRGATQETISLWTVSDLQMEVLYALEGDSPLTLRLRAGQRFPILSSSVGTAFMMSLPAAGRASLLRRLERRAQEHGQAADLARFREMIRAALRRGYAMADGALVPDVAAVSVPVRGRNLPRPLVVSVGGLAKRIRAQETRVAAALKTLGFD